MQTLRPKLYLMLEMIVHARYYLTSCKKTKFFSLSDKLSLRDDFDLKSSMNRYVDSYSCRFKFLSILSINFIFHHARINILIQSFILLYDHFRYVLFRLLFTRYFSIFLLSLICNITA